MQAKHLDRIWLAAGAVFTVVLIALTWFLMVSPQHQQRDGLRAQTDVAEGKVVALQRRLTELRKQQTKLEEYKATLASQRLALPAGSALDALLLEMRDAGTATGVAVTSLLVAPASEVTGSGAQLFQLPVTVISNGTGPQIERFLTQIQQVQPRAVLISTANVTADNQDKSFSQKVTMTLNMHVFVAPEKD